MKTSESDCFVGLIWMFVLDYGPQFLVCLVTFISLVTIFIVICTRAVRLEHARVLSTICSSKCP